jgi:hypothetical protein
LREPSLQALLRELAAFNAGLCVITTRTPVADIADHERTSALRRDLEQLSSDAGAKLLRALGVRGEAQKLRTACDEFRGHCLALTLLGSYLTDAYDGDIRYHAEVSARLVHDVRQGNHARKVMESYQTWFGEGPEPSVLRMLGLFDRPAAEKAVGALLKSPAIPGLTESLTNLSPTELRTVLARLRRARLLAGEDPHNPGYLDTHPLVREYFGEQLRSQQKDAWEECNRRLFHYYRTLAPRLPDSVREMEPLFLAVICGCNAGLYREALHEVYIPRIQRQDARFAANVLGARGALLAVLVHFFKDRHWGSPVEAAVEKQNLNAEDQLSILMQSAQYLSHVRGLAAPEVQTCYERAEPLCHALNRPLLMHVALFGQWRYSINTDKLSAAMRIAERVYSFAQQQSDLTPMMGAYTALAITHYLAGNFETSGQYAVRAVQIWRTGGVQFLPEELDLLPVTSLCYEAMTRWHLGDTTSCHAIVTEAISLAKELNDMHALAVALSSAAILGQAENDPSEVERLTSELIELSTRQYFPYWLAMGTVLRGWARSVSGDPAQGLLWIEDGMEQLRTAGSIVNYPYHLALRAESLYLAGRTSEVLAAITEAEAVAERSEVGARRALLYRLRGVVLAAMGAEETQIETSFQEAIRIAKKQKSVSLEKRAEATYAEYRRQKASEAGGRGFRLPLW